MKVNAGMWRVWTDIFSREPTHIVDVSCGHDGLHKNLSTVVEKEKPQVRAKRFKKGTRPCKNGFSLANSVDQISIEILIHLPATVKYIKCQQYRG